jgi:ketosteroid isomerase-like protein
MYRMFVAAQVRQLWAAINEAHVQPVLDIMAKPFSYTFVGKGHPLAGTRVTEETMRQQLERVEDIFPGIHFTVKDVVVKGWPWHTTFAACCDVECPLPDGSTYTNDLIQVVHLRWGKASHVVTTLDLHRLIPAYERVAKSGNDHALLAPLVG